jgi:uncharacterized protein (TIGR03083 family)
LIQREAAGMFDLVADDASWEAPTRAGEWQTRDVVGHLVDTTETYFKSFDAAAGKGEAPALVGLHDMAKVADEGARQLRDVPRSELVDRLKQDLVKMNGIFVDLTDEQWSGLMVPHKFMGPLPASFYAVFQLVDYAVHSWDIREGSGQPHGLAGDSADMLVPICTILWTATADVSAETEPYQVGLKITSGANAGDSVIGVSPSGVTIEPGTHVGLTTVLEFDPGSFVLTAYGRTNSGTVRGERATAHALLGSFFRI